MLPQKTLEEENTNQESKSNQQLHPSPPSPPQEPPHFVPEWKTLTCAEMTAKLKRNFNFPNGFNYLDILEVILNSHSVITEELMSQQMQVQIPIPPYKKLIEINQTTTAHLILLRAQIDGMKKQLGERNLALQGQLQRLQLEVEAEQSVQKARQEGAEKSGPPLNRKPEARSDRNRRKKAGRKQLPSAMRKRSEPVLAPPSEVEEDSTRVRFSEDDDDDEAGCEEPQPQLPKAKKGKRPRKQ